MLNRNAALSALWALSLLSVAPRAHAAGVEDTASGTQALGRGAHYARVRDYMATWQNPANLALLGDNTVGANLRVSLFDACFAREKDLVSRGPEAYATGADPYPEVCNEAPLLPSGSLGLALPFQTPVGSMGLGIGIFTPAGVGNLKFGDDTIRSILVLEDNTFGTTDSGQSSPNRFLLIERTVLAGFLAIGAGWAPVPQLRFGVTGAVGFADINYKNAATILGGEAVPASTVDGFDSGTYEVINDVNVADFFIPRVTASVAATPTPGVDIMLGLTWTDDINAEGDVDITANGLQGAALGNCREPLVVEGTPAVRVSGPGPRCRVEDVKLDVPYQRLQLMFGARYGKLRPGVAESVNPMADEVFDIELNAYWEQTSHVDTFSLQLPAFERPISEENSDQSKIELSGGDFSRASPLPQTASLPHNWQDTFGVRVGGDYNLLPNRLAIRLGYGFESRAVPVRNMNIDYWPVSKHLISLGATFRVSVIDLHVAYAHVINETITVPVTAGNVQQVVAVTDVPAWNVNEGKYTSSINIFSLGGSVRF